MGTYDSDVDDMMKQDAEFERVHGRYYDTAKIDLTKGDAERDLYLEGRVMTVPGYRFAAKIYDAPSEHGIDGGRISKLDLYRDHQRVASYDRGWSEEPQADDHGAKYALAEVMAAFSQTVEREQGAPRVEKNERPEPARSAAPVPAPSDDPTRAVNPMGFFRKQQPEPEAAPARKEWRSRDTTGIRHDAPAPDLSDDHEQDR